MASAFENFVLSTSAFVADFSKEYGSGAPAADLLILALGLTIVAFWLGIKSSKKEIVKHTHIDNDIVDALIRRVSKMEILTEELATHVKKHNEHMKGDSGYIKYELERVIGAVEDLRKEIKKDQYAPRDIFLAENERQRVTNVLEQNFKKTGTRY
jgi:hypothetical protein